MRIGSIVSRAAALGVAGVLLSAGAASAAEIKVMLSGGFSTAYRELVPQFERATGHKVTTSAGASMGGAPNSIPVRLQRGEPADVLIMAASALDGLIKEGKAVAGSRVDLARARIGMVVRAGAPKPDIGSVDALKRTLLACEIDRLFRQRQRRLPVERGVSAPGIADQIKDKIKRIESERVAAVVARGEAEIGFQQISELLPVPGVDLVGPLPPEVQRVTVFAAGVAVGAKEPDAAGALIKFLASPAAAAAITKSALEPMDGAPKK